MNFDGRAIANYILDRCEEKGRNITNLSLQKIIYFCHAWMLVKYKEPLVRHQFEAWEFGPVLPYVYRDFKLHGDEKITTRAFSLNLDSGERVIASCDLDLCKKEFLDSIIDFYCRLNAFDLVKMSHFPGGPWDQVWRHAGKVNPGMRIDNQSIGEFYAQKKIPFPLEFGTLQ